MKRLVCALVLLLGSSACGDALLEVESVSRREFRPLEIELDSFRDGQWLCVSLSARDGLVELSAVSTTTTSTRSGCTSEHSCFDEPALAGDRQARFRYRAPAEGDDTLTAQVYQGTRCPVPAGAAAVVVEQVEVTDSVIEP
ncbi:MAG: hypothetical protein KC933_15790 [Myxococcales bacterium]|nr:hypothetical protein [Myxococcales bacterium]MCB9673461.1 hypothetical protein [Alphaproteobacteria bacterium]